MELGIADRKAIVCASSKGLGRACARALAEAGCAVVLNGRDKEALNQTASELRKATGVEIREVLGDLDHAETRAELIAACPDADILVNNNGGPPYKISARSAAKISSRESSTNMLTPIALVQALAPGMTERKFGPNHQHHLEFGPGANRRPQRIVRRARGLNRVSRFRGAAVRARQRHDQRDPARIV